MTVPYRIHLLGFSDFERNALASYLRLAANRTPAYALADGSGDAHFLVVDADDPAALAASAGRGAQSVFVGAESPAVDGAWMLRPIDPLHVLRALDALAARLPAPAYAPPRPPPPARRRWLPARRATDGPAGGEGFVALPGARPREALVVDAGTGLLEHRLQVLGVATQSVHTPEQALERLAHQPFDFVFVDAELDGLALCQRIKRGQPEGAPVPVVAIVGPQPSELERARGSLAGCDAWLGKPVDTTALAALVSPTPAPGPG